MTKLPNGIDYKSTPESQIETPRAGVLGSEVISPQRARHVSDAMSAMGELVSQRSGATRALASLQRGHNERRFAGTMLMIVALPWVAFADSFGEGTVALITWVAMAIGSLRRPRRLALATARRSTAQPLSSRIAIHTQSR
jgi:hypothetical protein